MSLELGFDPSCHRHHTRAQRQPGSYTSSRPVSYVSMTSQPSFDAHTTGNMHGAPTGYPYHGGPNNDEYHHDSAGWDGGFDQCSCRACVSHASRSSTVSDYPYLPHPQQTRTQSHSGPPQRPFSNVGGFRIQQMGGPHQHTSPNGGPLYNIPEGTHHDMTPENNYNRLPHRDSMLPPAHERQCSCASHSTSPPPMSQNMPAHANGVSDHTRVYGPSDNMGAPYHGNTNFHLRNGPQPRQPQPTPSGKATKYYRRV
jgi:hypothetical protein